MIQKYFPIFVFLTIINSANAQNLWGAAAGIDVANAQFQNNFIETGTPGNYAANNWTALSIHELNGTVTPGAAYWKRNTLGYSQGAYHIGFVPVNSPSRPNGIAIFDSDYMDNNGTSGAFGTGTSPGFHKGELISPRIDLTGQTDTRIAVRFYSHYRTWQVTEMSISFSSDDGATWSVPHNYRMSPPVDPPQGFINVPLPLVTNGVTDLSQCRIKFTFAGNYYYSILDDVTIIVDHSLSIPENSAGLSFGLHPNPAQDVITLSGMEPNEKYAIYTILGCRVMEGMFVKNGTISIESLEKGMYFIQPEGRNAKKFIKE